MFTSSLSRVVRSTPSHSLSSSFTSWACTNSVAASTIPTLCRRHQRRQSSSKTSNPPDGGSRSLGAPAEASKEAASATKLNNEKNTMGRLGRRRSKDAPTETAGKVTDDAALNIPSVPSTQHRHPHDIQVASFFSIHRPISVTASVPPNSTASAFSSIFTARAKSKPQPADVIYTLSSTVNMLESAQGNQQPDTQAQQTSEALQLRTAVTQASVSNAEPGTKHLDGAPGNELGMSLQQLTDRFRPFTPPPAPVPMSWPEAQAREQVLAEQLKNEQAKPRKRSYTTVLTILESTHPNGQKTYEARTSPIVEHPQNSTAHQRHAPSSTSTSFLERMRIRQEKWEDFRDERARSMELLSTKRQRKLKMKKHKYKKLMKRTKHLRRRLSRT